MNIEFIKWMTKYAEGFSIETKENEIGINYIGFWVSLDILDIWVLKPLLLQRARRGWNVAHKTITYFIDMTKEYIELNCDVVNPPMFWYNTSEDEALEKALLYIYEQEKDK